MTPEIPSFIISADSRTAALGIIRGRLKIKIVAINADRRNPCPITTGGILHAARKEYGLAIKDFSDAITIKPDFSFAYKNQGSANMELENFGTAIDDFTRASELNPRDAHAFLYRGWRFLPEDGAGRSKTLKRSSI